MKINIPKRCINGFSTDVEKFSNLFSFGLMKDNKDYVTVESDNFQLGTDDMYGAYLVSYMWDVDGNDIGSVFGLLWELNTVESMPELILKCNLENPDV